ncbi:MAG: EAL domain-containing protein [Clostridiaceae bacterium]
MNKKIKKNIWYSLAIIITTIAILYVFIANYDLHIKNSNIEKLNQNNKNTIQALEGKIYDKKAGIKVKGELVSKFLEESIENISKENLDIITETMKNEDQSWNIEHSSYYVEEETGLGIDSKGLLNIENFGMDLRNRNWYKQAKNLKEPIITEPYYDINTGKPCITLSYGLYKEDKFLGVFSYDIFLEDMKDSLVDDLYDNKYGIYLVYNTGKLLIPVDGSMDDENINEISTNWEKISNNELNYIEYIDENNKNEIYGCFYNSELLNSKIFSFNKESIINKNEKNNKISAIVYISIISIILLIMVNFYIFYIMNSISGFKPKRKYLKDIKKISKTLSDIQILAISIKNLVNIKAEYGNKICDKVLDNYASKIKSIFLVKETMYSYSEKTFTVILTEKLKLEEIKSIVEELQNHKTKIENNNIEIETFIGIVNINSTELKNCKTEFKLQKIVDDYLKTDCKFIDVDYKNLIKKQGAEKEKLDILKEAINQDRIIPFFQAIEDVNTKKIEKYEVLMRIQQGRKYLSPYPFIVLAEKNNLIEAIDLKILEKALDYKNQIDKEDKLVFAFNISGKVLNDSGYLNKVSAIVDAKNIKNENIVFEITETQSIEDIKKFANMMNEFRKNRYRFSIDDFGTGYSSVYYLKNVSAYYLKIDGSFIKDINDNEQNLYLVKAMVNMAKAYKIKTVAEFIENEEIYNTVKELGIDFGQGYYIDKPSKEIRKR